MNEIREDQEICRDVKAEVPHFSIWSWVSNVVQTSPAAGHEVDSVMRRVLKE